MNMQEIASRFVSLVLKYERWSEVTTLPAEEIQVLFDLVSAAGFGPGSVVPGELFAVSDIVRVNNLCRFVVLDMEGNNNGWATGWLNDMVKYKYVYKYVINDNSIQHHYPPSGIVADKKKDEKNRAELIEFVAEEIALSIPFEPIQLTHEGDLLCEQSVKVDNSISVWFRHHTQDENLLGESIGIHKFCGGEFVRRRATKWNDALSCQGCSMPRILISREDIKTYGDLRRERRLKLLES